MDGAELLGRTLRVNLAKSFKENKIQTIQFGGIQINTLEIYKRRNEIKKRDNILSAENFQK
eukprot:UN08811